MKEQEISLAEFLNWFSEQEDIPLEQRIQFLEHVQEKGMIDEKAMSFVDQYLHKKDSEFKQKIDMLSDELVFTRTQLAFEKNTETSSVNRIQSSLGKTLTRLTTNFKNKWNSYETKIAKREETAEDIENAAQIARLKAAL